MESIIGKILCDRYRIIQQLSSKTPQLFLAQKLKSQQHQQQLPPANQSNQIIPDSFSRVYLAEDRSPGTNIRYTIRRIKPQYDHEVLGNCSWQQVRQIFMTQGEIWQNISQHPQIPQLLAFFECDREFYLVHELIDSTSLEQRVKDSPIDESEAIIWLHEMIDVLGFIHRSGAAHYNIQPSSLVELQNGTKLLTNSALIENHILLNYRTSNDTSNFNLATSASSPKIDFDTDILALGTTIIYALTSNLSGSKPYESKDEAQFFKLGFENLSNVNINPKLTHVLQKMVSQEPHERYQSASEILAELDFDANVVVFPPPYLNSYSPQSSTPAKVQRNRRTTSTDKSKYVARITWLLVTLPFFIAGVIIFVGINRNSQAKFANYANNDYQFAIKYPQDWLLRQLEDPITGEVVVFTSPLEDNSDLFLEKLYISVEYLAAEATSLEQYSETVFQRIKQTEGSEIEYEEQKTIIDDLPARKIIYSRQEGGLQLKQMETFTILDNQVYVAIYTAESDKFSKFYSSIEKMIDSWEIQ